MKKFLTRVLVLIVLPLFILSVLYEYVARKIPNVYSYKNEWMSKNIQSVKILNLGSSHGYFGIDPYSFSVDAFNAAHESQDLKYDHFIFSKFLNQMDSLKVLILPVSYFTFVGNGLENSNEYWRVKYYCIYYKCKYHRFQLYYNSEFYNDLYHRDLHFKDLVSSVFGKVSYVDCDELGNKRIRSGFDDRSDDWWEENGYMRAIYHTMTIDSLTIMKNMEYVEQMIEKCAQKGIVVYIVTTPTYKTYRKNTNSTQLQIMLNCCNYFYTKYDNVIYHNLIADTLFTTKDFADSDHLNEIGAIKLTKKLQKTIDSLGTLQP